MTVPIMIVNKVSLHVEYDCAYYDREQGQPACRI